MRLNKLRVMRSPGLATPFSLEPASGFNLVTGPNGVGKSSVCRAVLSLLWPDLKAQQPFDAEAEFTLGSERLTVSRQDRETPVWLGGPRPNLGPDHLAGRHLLGVIDLLAPGPGGDPLAREIRQQMAGGFDLGNVRSALFATGTGISEKADLKKALELIIQLKSDQKALDLEQNELEQLTAEKNLAQAAGRRLAALETLRDLIQEMETRDDASSRVDDLPPACALIRSDDPQNLKDLRSQATNLRREITNRQDAREKIRAEKKDLVSGGGMDADLDPGLLKKKIADLTELRRDLRLAEREAKSPDLTEVVSQAAVKPAWWPAASWTAVGIGLIAVSLVFSVPGPYLPLGLVLLGGMAAMAGILGWRNYRADAHRSTLAFDQEARLAKARDHEANCRGQLNDALLDFNATLATGGLDSVAGVDEASQIHDDLTARRERLIALAADLLKQEEFLARDQADLDRVTREAAAIRERLGLADETAAPAEAADLLQAAPRFETAVGLRDDAARQIVRLEKRLADNAAHLGADESPTMSTDLLAERIATEIKRAADHDGLVKDIADIELRIETASGGHLLQDALDAATSARADLAAVRQSKREAALGNLLLDLVQQQHETESRPRVLEAADDLFHLFTGRTHHLELAPSGDGEDRFLARAENSSRPLELSELSDGTRAQLLLAVRLAFLTGTEAGVRAPIFLDDSLTSADPVRFAAVAGSLGRLVQDEERQIFYLTPNPTDAAAIQRVLAEADLPPAHHLDLARIRGVAGAAEPALLDPANLPGKPMAPNPVGMSAAEYGAALLVPAPDPWATRNMLHVFYLLSDELDLVRRLVDAGAATIGRFASARETLVDARIITTAEADLVAAGADVWNAWVDNWRLGRAQPVSPAFLSQSSAVSDTFIEPVTEALEKCGWDGAGLLKAIENKQVKKFRTNKLEELRQELEEAGLLAHGVPLSTDDLISHTIDRVKGLLASEILDMTKVRTLALTFARLVAAEAVESAD